MTCTGCGGSFQATPEQIAESKRKAETHLRCLVVNFKGTLTVGTARFPHVRPGVIIQLPMEYVRDGWPQSEHLVPYNKDTARMAKMVK